MELLGTQAKALTAEIVAASIFRPIEEEMGLVEHELERQASSNVQVVDYLGRYLLET